MRNLCKIVRVISLVSMMGILTACMVPFSNDKGQFNIESTIVSPSKNFTAYQWLGMGGGAAGWCYRKITILRAGDSLPLETETEPNRISYVFSASCSSNIGINWIDDTHLKITYSLGEDRFPLSFSQASRTEDGSVKIIYEIVEK